MYYLALYIVIGNSDNKLTQKEWSEFCGHVNEAVRAAAHEVHGEWYSVPNAPYQNACWSIVINDTIKEALLQDALHKLARLYRQSSIVWAPAPDLTFIPGAD